MTRNYGAAILCGGIASYAEFNPVLEWGLLGLPTLAELSKIPLHYCFNKLYDLSDDANRKYIEEDSLIPRIEYTKYKQKNYVRNAIVHAGLVGIVTASSYALITSLADGKF